MDSKQISILYESENYLIVDKPPDLLINSNDGENENTLHRILLQQGKVATSRNLVHGFHFVHRLDFATSGVICLAKTKTASTRAGRLFETRCVKKYYLAIVRGYVRDELMSIDGAIGYDKMFLESNKKMRTNDGINCINPKEAKTNLIVLERGYYDSKPATKVMLKPMSGRRHQLRVHCSTVGHTIVGDFTYSDGGDVDPPRMFLHAYRLVLPIDGEPIDVTTADPFGASSRDWCGEEILNGLDGDGGSVVFEKLDNAITMTE